MLKKVRLFQNDKYALDVADGLLSLVSVSNEESNIVIFPGFCDVHVHLREPGFSYKETIASGSKASAHGGYTTVCPMPNLKPVPDNFANLKQELDIIERDAVIEVIPYGSCTVNEEGQEMAALEEMSDHVCAFSDDGKGIQQEEMMRQVMLEAKRLNKIVAAHCEVNDLLHGGYIHDGVYAKQHGHKGICSESEWKEIERDVRLAYETGCKYHVCHISTKESVEIIRNAKKIGADVTCETAPHYLILDENDLQENGKFKMNPPLRSTEDREALIEGLLDGTIDMIATDHAPHAAHEKDKGLEKSAFGIVGIETAFQLLYTYLVKKGIISLEKLVELRVDNPRKRFIFPLCNSYSVWDLDKKYTIDPDNFLSAGKATPFEGVEVYGECLLTVCNGKVAYQK
ncbi:MAG: dihydroorotase [Erysipelotrichaceae bacterium]|nr:dihydroorotase [Erysipelotrichaceae bacterium]